MDLQIKAGEELDEFGASMEPPIKRANMRHVDTGYNGVGIRAEWLIPESDHDYRQRLIAAVSRAKTGGPAFGDSSMADGMSIRDYFAAKALTGYIANKAAPTRFSPEDDAKYFYEIADAMLAERAK